MMRNSINSYLTSLVMVLALLFSANAFATETVRSTITIDDEEYALFTGFNAINGAAGTNADPDFVRLVDGDISSEWSAVLSQAGEYAFVEFSSDYPIILRGFIVNLYNTTVSRHPTEVKLYAKANEADEYVEVSSYSVATSSDMERTFPITMENNTMYRYFKFEFANSGRNIKLTEIRLYGEKELTYGFMPEKNASCMETGIKQACYLRSDGRYFTDKTGTKELSKEDVIDPLKPHDLIHHEEDDAHYEYWECSVCGKRFGDAEGTKELDIVDFTYDYTKYRILTNSSDNWLFFRINDTHSINSKRSVVGDVVTLKVLERYIDVNSIKVSDGANDYPITSEGNGIYSFTVPASDVTISAEIKPEYKEPTFFGIGNDELDNYIFTPGVSTVRLNSDIRYVIRNRVGLMLDSKDITTRLYVPFADVEGEFRDALSVGISVTETGWYDISFNEVGDGKWNLSISATTRKPQIETISDQVYTGEDIMPKPVVTLDLYDLTEGSDYEYSYSNNVNVGSSATVTVTFKGDYAEFGSISKSFNITKATPTVIPPTSADPKYAGTCVALVVSGSSNSGDMLYSVLREGGSQTAYSTGIPCADWAGRYTVYYKVEERDNWSSVEGSVDVTVENEKFTVTFVDAEGETISSGKYPYGTPVVDIAKPTGNPEKADDEMYAYTFAGWSPEIQDVTGAKTYRPIYGKTRIGFGSATIAADGSWAIIDGKSSKKIDADLDAVEITGDVTLNREFVAEKPSTIVLPFGTHIDNVPGFTFYSFKGVVKENGVWKKVVFDEVDKEGDGRIYANTPYIVVAKEDVGGLIVENGVVFDLNSVRPMSSEGGIWQFVGTYDFKVWNEGDRDIGRSYGFAAEERDGARIGQFVMLGSNAYAYPMRAYLYYAGGNSGESRSMAPALFKAAPAVASIDELPESMDVVIRGEEGTTVIGTINSRTGEFRSADNRWFDLNGRYLGNKKPTIKGTYYNNGKKVVVK